MFVGDEVRLLATRKKFIAAVIRRPASVIGDGKSTVKKLMDIKNHDPKKPRLKIEGAPRLFLESDADMVKVLKQQGYSMRSKPKKGERIFLRKTSNICQGGDSIDVTNQIHDSVKKIAIKAIKVIPELKFAGIDFMTKDYTKKQTPKTYTILEMNHNPMINMHYYPYEGISRNVAIEVLKEFFNL